MMLGREVAGRAHEHKHCGGFAGSQDRAYYLPTSASSPLITISSDRGNTGFLVTARRSPLGLSPMATGNIRLDGSLDQRR